jgi:hypothetical protein
VRPLICVLGLDLELAVIKITTSLQVPRPGLGARDSVTLPLPVPEGDRCSGDGAPRKPSVFSRALFRPEVATRSGNRWVPCRRTCLDPARRQGFCPMPRGSRRVSWRRPRRSVKLLVGASPVDMAGFALKNKGFSGGA